jgi:hypothetical protein
MDDVKLYCDKVMSIYMYMALEIFYVKVLCYALAAPLSF